MMDSRSCNSLIFIPYEFQEQRQVDDTYSGYTWE